MKKKKQVAKKITRYYLVEQTLFPENMTYQECRRRHDSELESFISVCEYDNGFSISEYTKRLICVGDKVFTKTYRLNTLAYRSGKWYGNGLLNISGEALNKVLNHFKLDWVIDMEVGNYLEAGFRRIVLSKRYLKDIVYGNISNEEKLWKTFVKRSLRTKLPWKSARLYFEKLYGSRHSIYDIISFCSNPDMAIEKLADDDTDPVKINDRRVFADLFEYAAEEGRKINCKWSTRRMMEEHNKQIIAANRAAIGAKDQYILYSKTSMDIVNSDKVHILCSEQDVFEKATLYSNCVYRLYFDRIAKGEYMAVILSLNDEEAMLGIRFEEGIRYDQCFLRFNHVPTKNMIDFANKFIEDNKSILCDMSTFRKGDYKVHPICKTGTMTPVAAGADFDVDEPLPW